MASRASAVLKVWPPAAAWGPAQRHDAIEARGAGAPRDVAAMRRCRRSVSIRGAAAGRHDLVHSSSTSLSPAPVISPCWRGPTSSLISSTQAPAIRYRTRPPSTAVQSRLPPCNRCDAPEGYSNLPIPALSPAKQPAKPTADVQPSMRSSAHHEAELAAMTSELARLRERNASLKQQQEMMNVQLKSEQRAHSSCSSSVSSTPFRAKAALISEDDLRRRGEERLASAERTSAAAKGAAADWRMASVETLDRTLALLRKGRARDGGAGDLAVTLEKSRTGLALLAAGAVQEAHEAQDQERRSGIKEAGRWRRGRWWRFNVAAMRSKIARAACRALLLTWLTRPKSWQEESGMQPEARVEKTITKASAPHESSGGRFSFSRAFQICVYAVS